MDTYKFEWEGYFGSLTGVNGIIVQPAVGNNDDLAESCILEVVRYDDGFQVWKKNVGKEDLDGVILKNVSQIALAIQKALETSQIELAFHEESNGSLTMALDFPGLSLFGTCSLKFNLDGTEQDSMSGLKQQVDFLAGQLTRSLEREKLFFGEIEKLNNKMKKMEQALNESRGIFLPPTEQEVSLYARAQAKANLSATNVQRNKKSSRPSGQLAATAKKSSGQLIDTAKMMPDVEKFKDVIGVAKKDGKPFVLGRMPQFSSEKTETIMAAAKKAWKGGNGVWPQMSMSERVDAMERFLVSLQKKREDIVQMLMWEIGKNSKDAQSEFDRTIVFCKEVIDVLRTDEEYNASWQTIGSVQAFVRRAAIGIIMCLGPFNYPLNETYATLIPALLMGNIVILKIPTVGGLVHFLTMDAFKELPPGTIHFVSGSGRATMPPLMASGDMDGLAFIGGSNAADALIKQHPNPHRLKVFLQLEANNMGIFLNDLFERENKDALENALDQAVTGSLSYNGQRCTALKLLMVPTAHGEIFAKSLSSKVEQLSIGLPWETGTKITPLPNMSRIEYMQELIKDATSKGAKIMNPNGGTIVGGESTLMVPAVLYPVTKDMKVYEEEQFGPVVAIAPYESMDEVVSFGLESIYAQQVSIFTQLDHASTSKLVDTFSSVFGKINLNSQCARSPDTLPFSGRRSSAMGVMSIKDGLREFSVPTVVSYKDAQVNPALLANVEKNSKFLQCQEAPKNAQFLAEKQKRKELAAIQTAALKKVEERQSELQKVRALVGADSGSFPSGQPSRVSQLVDTAKMMPDVEKFKDVIGVGRTDDSQPVVLGRMPQFTSEKTESIMEAAKEAWDGGNGVWPQMSMWERIDAVERFLEALQKKRDDIILMLMWEIGKNLKDATSEFDRTIVFCQQVIAILRTDGEYNASWKTIGSVNAFVRRAAIGIIMCLGPFNYPLNETYATLIPALLMGNIVILKIPTVGGLVHFLTMEAFEELPPGTIHFVSGSGRATMPPLMASGAIDGLAFIGGSNAADALIKQHPNPHRLKNFLQLEANNMGIFLEDLFERKNKDALEHALDQSVLGSLSYNGQRCTALKLLMVPKAHGVSFAKGLADKVEQLSIGLPWETPKITPLPNSSRIKYMQELIEDATSKGARIMNKNGGTIVGDAESTLMVPAVLYPVTKDMKVYEEEQFGPVVAIAPYESMDEVVSFGLESIYAQQVAIFTELDHASTTELVDTFSSVFGKINLNSQCARSPDTLPFSGRRSSAMGVMSIKDGLREFSVPTVVSYKDAQVHPELVRNVEKTSKFLQPQLEGGENLRLVA